MIYKQSLQRQTNLYIEKTNIIFWILLSMICLGLAIMPFYTGLFYGYTPYYEEKIYSACLWTAVGLFIFSFYLLGRWHLLEGRDGLVLFVWIVPLSYFLSLTNAVSPHIATNELFFHMMYAVSFLITAYFARSSIGAKAFQYTIVLSGYAVVLYGYMNMFGNVYFPEAVIKDPIVEGIRLTSVFQYPNAYAAFTMVVVLCCLYLIVKSAKWYWVGLHAVMLVPILVSFLLTYSRGAIVVLPVILLALLPLLSITRQLVLLMYLLIGTVGSLPILDLMKTIATRVANRTNFSSTTSVLAPDSLQGWTVVGLTSIVTATVITLCHVLISPYLNKKLAHVTERWWSRWLISLLLVLLGVVGSILVTNSHIIHLLPGTLQNRLMNINIEQHSVLERFTFYKDSVKMAKDYPVIGAGGGAWFSLFQKYQNNPYISRQTHSFLFQSLLETGLVGLIGLVAFLFTLFYFYYKNFFQKVTDPDRHILFYIISISVLAHSMIDFEMSYVYLSLLIYVSLGGMASSITTPLPYHRFTTQLPLIWRKYTFPAAICLLSIAFMYFSFTHVAAARHYKASLDALNSTSEQLDLAQALDPLNQALRLVPGHPDYSYLKITLLSNAYNQSKDESYYNEMLSTIQELKTSEPFFHDELDIEFNHYLQKQQWKEALSVTKQYLSIVTWGITPDPRAANWYERAIVLNYQLGDEAKQKANPSQNKLYWDNTMALFQTVLAKKEHLKTLPKGQLQGEPFEISFKMRYAAGCIYYYRGEYKAASDQFKLLLAENKNKEDTSQTITRWYLASLENQGIQDVNLYNQFTSQYPDEINQIHALVRQK